MPRWCGAVLATSVYAHQVLQWHAEESIGFGYAMNMMEVTPTNERGRVLQEVVQNCARNLKGGKL